MKITKNQLRQIIQEELASSLDKVDTKDELNIGDLASSDGETLKISPNIPTDFTLGGTQEFEVGDKGKIEVGGRFNPAKFGRPNSLDDVLSSVSAGVKGKYDLGQGVGAYGSVDYTIAPSPESLGKIQSTLGMGLTFNDMSELGILVPFSGAGFGGGNKANMADVQGRVGLNLGALNLAMHAGKGGARTGNIGASANLDVFKLARKMNALKKKQKLKEAIKRAIKEELAVVLNESPPLFSQPSALERLPSPASPASQFISDFDPAERLKNIIAPEQDSNMINIQRVFDPEGNVLDSSKGAALTAQTLKLLGATTGGVPPKGTPIDITIDMNGEVISAAVANKLSPTQTH